MNLTPLEIRKHEFSRKMRGFDVDEVTSFLEMIADNYESLLTKLREQTQQLEDCQVKLQDYRQMETTLQEAMITAKKAGQNAEAESEKQAQFIRQKAQLEADQLILETRRKHQRLLDDIDKLEGQRRSFMLKMKQILRGQIDLLEVMDEESPVRRKETEAEQSEDEIR